MTTATANATVLFLPIPPEVAARARRTLRDEFGHQLQIEAQQAPCRVCLRVPAEPEEMILLSYQPLADTGPYAEIGPIFIHAAACEPYAELETMPPDFESRSLVVRAYGHNGRILTAAIAQPGR